MVYVLVLNSRLDPYQFDENLAREYSSQYYRVFQNSSSYARGRDVIIDRAKEKVSYHLVIVVQVVLQDLLVITSVVEHLQPQIRIFSLLHRLLHFRHSRQILVKNSSVFMGVTHYIYSQMESINKP